MIEHGTENEVSCAREASVLAASWGGVVLLTWVTRSWETALAVGYMLALVLALGWGAARLLVGARPARAVAGVLLVLATLACFQPAANPEVRPAALPGVRFPTNRARAFHEIAVPPDRPWRGETWVYVGLEGEIADLASASPVLSAADRPLALEVAPERAFYLRARVPEAFLDSGVVRFAFGFAAPSPRLGLARCVLYEGALDRAPSAFSLDGSIPPLGPPRTPRSRGLLGLLGRGARFELGERFVIELWLLDGQGRVRATCY